MAAPSDSTIDISTSTICLRSVNSLLSPWPSVVSRSQREFFGNLRKLSENLWRFSEVFRNLRQSSEAVGKSSKIQALGLWGDKKSPAFYWKKVGRYSPVIRVWAIESSLCWELFFNFRKKFTWSTSKSMWCRYLESRVDPGNEVACKRKEPKFQYGGSLKDILTFDRCWSCLTPRPFFRRARNSAETQARFFRRKNRKIGWAVDHFM